MSGTYDAPRLAKSLKLSDGVGYLGRLLIALSTNLYEEITEQNEITAQQFGVLLTLHQQGELTLTEVVRQTCADRSTIGEMVRRMEARGLIERVAGSRDRRTKVISITAAGTDALLKIVPLTPLLQERLLSPLDPAKRAIFVECLKAIVSKWSGPEGIPAGDQTSI